MVRAQVELQVLEFAVSPARFNALAKTCVAPAGADAGHVKATEAMRTFCLKLAAQPRPLALAAAQGRAQELRKLWANFAAKLIVAELELERSAPKPPAAKPAAKPSAPAKK